MSGEKPESKISLEQMKQQIASMGLTEEQEAQLNQLVQQKKNPNQEKLYKCAVCREHLPKNQYSGKQMKAKGKRKCNECVSVKAAQESTESMNFGGAKAAKLLSAVNGENETAAVVVKQALASDVKKVQESFKTETDAKLDDKYTVLLKWLADGGATFPKLMLKFYTLDYRGVHARSRLLANEEILAVPLTHIMTTTKAQQCAIGLRLQAALARGEDCIGSSHSWLASMLLQEKHDPNSFWKPYIDTLPMHYRNMPIFFDDDELKELKGSFTLEMIKNRRTSLKMEYDTIVKSVPEYKQFHHIEFMWARLAVITRIFGFEVNGEKTDGLVPMADMLNHKRPNETTWTFEDYKNSFTITTTKQILKGGQIFDSYGRKCNSRYFVNYGFALDENEDNQVNLLFTLFPQDQDPLFPQKLALLRNRRRFFQIPFDHLERIQDQCFSYLRIKHANAEELTEIQRNERNDIRRLRVGMVSCNNEVNVLADLAASSQMCLSRFDTSLEEDEKLLSDKADSLTMNVRNCIVQRRGEKQICHAYINLYNIARDTDAKGNGDQWKDAKTNGKAFRKSVNSKIKGKGRQPSILWRVEKYVEDVWMSFLSGKPKELNISSNAHEGD